MKSLVKKKGHPLKIQEVPIPALVEGCSLIKNKMAGICRTDVYVAQGVINSEKDNLIIGHEFCGEIESTTSSSLKKGDLVFVNPLMNDGTFLGVDHDGCFSEYSLVKNSQIYNLNPNIDHKVAAYIEPIAASLAPLKAKSLIATDRIGIYGNNRIAELTKMILLRSGVESEIVNKDSTELNAFDVIIETEMSKEAFDKINKLLKKGGTVILKSRFPNHFPVNMYDFVRKEINFESCYYHSFEYAIKFAEKNKDLFEPLFGDAYDLENYEEAFKDNLNGNKKIFFKL